MTSVFVPLVGVRQTTPAYINGESVPASSCSIPPHQDREPKLTYNTHPSYERKARPHRVHSSNPHFTKICPMIRPVLQLLRDAPPNSDSSPSLSTLSPTYDHRPRRTGQPSRAAIHKPSISELRAAPVTTSEYPLLYVLQFPFCLYRSWSLSCLGAWFLAVERGCSGCL